MKSTRLAGSLSKYKQKRRFPSRQEMKEAFAEGIVSFDSVGGTAMSRQSCLKTFPPPNENTKEPNRG